MCHAYARSNFSIAQNLPTAFEHINDELAADLGSRSGLMPFAAAVLAVLAVRRWKCSLPVTVHSFFIRVRRIGCLTTYAHALPLGMFPFSKSTSSRPPLSFTPSTRHSGLSSFL